MESIKKWSKAHTFGAVAIVAVLGYLAYNKWGKKKSNASSSFTGGDGSYFNADAAKKDTTVKNNGPVLVDINRPK